MLHRYWIVFYPEDIYGPRNIGVTAFSETHARNLVKQQIKNIGWMEITAEMIDSARIIPDIDIRLLDPGHVIPNMGAITFEGIWFPNLNL